MMMQRDPRLQGDRPIEQNARIHPDLYNNGADEGGCPECGVPLTDVDARSHAVLHYGEEPIPVRHNTLLARQRQAVIMGQPLPEY